MHGVLDRHWMFMVHWSRMDQMAHVMSGVGVHSRMTMVGHKGSRMVTMVAVHLMVFLVNCMVGAMV